MFFLSFAVRLEISRGAQVEKCSLKEMTRDPVKDEIELFIQVNSV